MTAVPEWVDVDRARECGLTPRMQDILVGLAKGWSDAEISEFLFLGTSTVHRGTKAIYKRLGASGRTHAVAMAYDYAILRTRAMRLELAQAAGLRVAA